MVTDDSDHWSNRPRVYCFGLVVLAALLSSFAFDWGEGGVLGWIGRHYALASWIQAGGTLIALVIAIGVPWFLHSREIRERQTDRVHQAQGIALLIRPSLVVLKGKLKRELALAKNGAAPAEFRAIKVPKTITGQIDQLWMMGGAGGHALQLISTLDADAQTLDEFTHYMNRAEQDLIIINRMLASRTKILEAARNDATDALIEIEEILTA